MGLTMPPSRASIWMWANGVMAVAALSIAAGDLLWPSAHQGEPLNIVQRPLVHGIGWLVLSAIFGCRALMWWRSGQRLCEKGSTRE